MGVIDCSGFFADPDVDGFSPAVGGLGNDESVSWGLVVCAGQTEEPTEENRPGPLGNLPRLETIEGETVIEINKRQTESTSF